MLGRLAFLTYGLVCYLAFLATFLYAIAFVSGIGVARALDGRASGPLLAAIGIDAALLGLFAVQHSVMARRWFKERWTRLVPVPIERSTFVLCASLALAVLMGQWRPLGGSVWRVDDPAGRAILWTLFGLGWTFVLVCTLLIDHLELFGVRQVWDHFVGRPHVAPRFVTPGPYRLVRHPLYLGFLLAFWATPQMTLSHLLFASATTAYILLAIQFEERDLVRLHGRLYSEYRQRVSMLLPLPLRARVAEGHSAGAAIPPAATDAREPGSGRGPSVTRRPAPGEVRGPVQGDHQGAGLLLLELPGHHEALPSRSEIPGRHHVIGGLRQDPAGDPARR
jgi:protein-S-isoprenylcysteine O-methyltransferase Ste14